MLWYEFYSTDLKTAAVVSVIQMNLDFGGKSEVRVCAAHDDGDQEI